ncbi:hypothetical protein HPB50_021855 [Hyalomma asiaticum]|uniref:Uncharacterized protein n=1 Tax=Hyalomma asiaticum TaxID=266040 RepID=A0ACB7RKV2_HYAAI|nr:hypothetical protein HPB50_021855 [Hyalomma asiaticum]
MFAFREQNHTFATPQHGFLPNCSYETALVTLIHYVSVNMDSALSTDLIQLDLSNAFDTLDHAILARQAPQAGIRGTLLLWLARFLVGGWQRVLHHGSYSVLGPTLFCLYVNDMAQSNEVLLAQYTGDTSILAGVSS